MCLHPATSAALKALECLCIYINLSSFRFTGFHPLLGSGKAATAVCSFAAVLLEIERGIESQELIVRTVKSGKNPTKIRSPNRPCGCHMYICLREGSVQAVWSQNDTVHNAATEGGFADLCSFVHVFSTSLNLHFTQTARLLKTTP